ncbi:MAG: hypothetical protein R2940_10230 [Syntrophotaleaceae bacterium]
MTLSETSHYLYADVKQWRWACDCPCPGAADEGPARMLQLSGITNSLFADFVAPLPLELTLLGDEFQADDEIANPWQLSLIDDLEDLGIPTLLAGLLILPKAIWSDLKESLFLAAGKPGCDVQMRLETREFLGKPSVDGPKRSFAVTAFGFDLRHQKEKS